MIDDQVETAKVDFKVSLSTSMNAAEKVELAKDINALVNVDSDGHSGFGFLIFGARRGELVGGISCLAADSADHTSSTISKIVSEYLAPCPILRLLRFDEPSKGSWGVLLVAPSEEQPHIFVKEYSGNPKRGDWFVRVNDTTQLAGPADYVRVLTKRTGRASDRYERQIQDLTLRLARLETESSLSVLLPRFLQLKEDSQSDSPAPILTAGDDLHTRIRRTLTSPTSAIEDDLLAHAARLQTTLDADPAECPWALHRPTTEVAERCLGYMETAAKPLVLAVAAVARYDREEHLNLAIERAFGLLAVEPDLIPGRNYSEPGRNLRLYPLALLIYSLVLASLYERRSGALTRVLRLRLYSRDRETPGPLIDSLLAVGRLDDVFNAAANTQNAIPFAGRIRTVLGSWLGEFLPVRDFRDFMYVGEFIVGLIFMKGTGLSVSWPVSVRSRRETGHFDVAPL